MVSYCMHLCKAYTETCKIFREIVIGSQTFESCIPNVVFWGRLAAPWFLFLISPENGAAERNLQSRTGHALQQRRNEAEAYIYFLIIFSQIKKYEKLVEKFMNHLNENVSGKKKHTTQASKSSV